MAKTTSLTERSSYRFVPLPEVPGKRFLGRRSPLAVALQSAYEKKQAVVIELRGERLAKFTGSLNSTFKRDGLRVRCRTDSNLGYVWLEKAEKP